MSKSIKDISRLCGVSTATVSRVLNNVGNVSPKTEARVKEVIERYGYSPNLIAKGLRTNLMSSVGIIVPDVVNEPYGVLVRIAQQQLMQYGIMSIVCNTSDDAKTAQQYVTTLKSQYVSGIIYVLDSNYRHIQFGDLPVVYYEHRPSHPLPQSSVVIESDDRKGGYIATRELLEKGCRNIAIYLDSFGFSSYANRYLGYCDALIEFKIKPKPENIIHVNPIHATDSIKKTQELFKQKFLFDGVLCTSNRTTTGVMNALSSAGMIHLDGLRKNDVKLIGYEDLRMSVLGLFPVTSVDIGTEIMATAAVDALVGMLKGKPSAEKEVILPVNLVRRNTT